MKYLCLVYVEEVKRDALPFEDLLALVNETKSYIEELKVSRQYIAAEPLEPVSTATTCGATCRRSHSRPADWRAPNTPMAAFGPFTPRTSRKTP